MMNRHHPGALDVGGRSIKSFLCPILASRIFFTALNAVVVHSVLVEYWVIASGTFSYFIIGVVVVFHRTSHRVTEMGDARSEGVSPSPR